MANPSATVTVTISNFVSVSSRLMLTTGATPDASVSVSASGRIAKQHDGSLKVSGQNPDGTKGLDLSFAVLPATYAVIGISARTLSGPSTAWSNYKVKNDGTVDITDTNPGPGSYEFYLLVQVASAGSATGQDFGLIDPLIANS